MRLEIGHNIINLKRVDYMSDDTLLCVSMDDKNYILNFSGSNVCKASYEQLLINGYLESWRYIIAT